SQLFSVRIDIPVAIWLFLSDYCLVVALRDIVGMDNDPLRHYIDICSMRRVSTLFPKFELRIDRRPLGLPAQEIFPVSGRDCNARGNHQGQAAHKSNQFTAPAKRNGTPSLPALLLKKTPDGTQPVVPYLPAGFAFRHLV